MAFYDKYAPTGNQTEEYAFQGFSLSAFRKVNQFKLYLKTQYGDPKLVIKAYSQGNFSYDGQLSVEGFADKLVGFLNKLGALNRSFVSNAGNQEGLGQMSGAFDAPLHPHVTSTQPLKFQLDGFLPLFDPLNPTDDPSVAYSENIEKPLNTLLKVVFPDVNKATDKGVKELNEGFEKVTDWLFGNASDFWTKVQNTINGMKNDFIEGIYQLDNPIQFAKSADNKHTNSLILRMGPWRIEDIFITDVKVDWGAIMYAADSGVFPDHVKFSIQCCTTKKVTVNSLGIGGNHNKI